MRRVLSIQYPKPLALFRSNQLHLKKEIVEEVNKPAEV